MNRFAQAIYVLAGAGALLLSACQATPSGSQVNQAVPLHLPPAECAQEQKERQVDYIVIQKKDWLMALWKDGRVIRTYPIMALGANPVGQKVYEGDERTPEGDYFISDKHISQNFQKFLKISYPNDHDRLLAKRFGLSPGGSVGIHGDRGGVSGLFQRMDRNWTDGCIALRNKDVEEVYALVDVGTPILIKP